MNGNADDTRNFTATLVGGGYGYENQKNVGRRKSSKVNPNTNPLGLGSTSAGANKPKYPKKPPLMPDPDPDAPKIARPCSECGKKFWSWKALFGHMRCHPERQWRGINPPPNFRRQSPSPPSLSEDNVAGQNCYYASSTSIWGGDESLPSGDYYYNNYYYYSSEKQHVGGIMTEEDHEVAGCLLLLANNGNGVDYCRTKQQNIKKIIESSSSNSSSVIHSHSCSMCSRVFSSGRALGGHKRFHCRDKFKFTVAGREEEEAHIHHPSSSIPNNYNYNYNYNYLDLNLLPTTISIPAPRHQDHSAAALPTLDLRLGL